MNRILVLTELFLPTKGGTAVWAAEVYRRLGGKDIHIVTADVDGAEDYDARSANSIHRLDLRRIAWVRPESLVIYSKLLLRALWLGLTRRFDSVHAIRALPEGFVAWLVARLTFRTLVVYAHGEELTSWGEGAKYRLMRFVLRHADYVIANSEHTRATLLSMGVSEPRIHTIFPGVDIAVFRKGLDAGSYRAQLGVAEGEKLMFSVGRLSRRKGFDQALRAVASLRKEGFPVHYAIAGIGEDEHYLKGIIAELGLQDVVHMLGAVAPGDLPLWMNACDVFVMPNRQIGGDNEGFGMVFIEAAACGKTAIAGVDGGTGSAVLDGVTGLRVDGNSTDAIAAAIHRVLSDADFAQTLSEKAHARVLHEFAWERVADKTRQLLMTARH